MTDLPTKWELADGDDLFACVRGVTYSKADAASTPADGLVPILRANNITNGDIVADDLVYVPAKYVSPEQYLRAGDLLIATSSGSRTVVGKAATASEEHKPYAFGAFCTVARPRVEGLGDWLSLFARTRAYRDYVEQVALGININNLRGSDLKSMMVRLAPLPEQRRIVSKIDSLTGKSRPARDHLDHIPRLAEKYKQAVLAAAFRGDLTREWRAEKGGNVDGETLIEAVRAERDTIRRQRGLRTKGRNRSVPTKIIDLTNLPLGWGWATFDDCSWDMTVGHVGPMKDRYVDKGITFLRSLNVRPNRVDLTKVVYIDRGFNDELVKSQLHPGDLVVVRTGEPGVAAVIPAELGLANCSDLVIARLVNSVNPHFAAYYMNSDYAQSVVGGFQVGVAQQHFNVGAMSEMPLPLVSESEQQEIVRRIETAFVWIDRLASEATSARRLIDRLDQAVLAKAFRGQLVQQDPADEPASILLERIRAGRGAAPKARRGRRSAA